MKSFTFFLMLISTFCFSQEKKIQKIASKVSIESLKKDLYYLASEQLEGRDMGSRGDTLASEYIMNSFKENNLVAPYNNGTSFFQAISFYKKILGQSALIIGDKKFENRNGWNVSLPNTESFKLDGLSVVFVGYGIENSKYNDFSNIDVKGKAVLLFVGQPQDSAGNYLLSGDKLPARIPSPANLLKEKGAALIIMYNKLIPDAFFQQKNPLVSFSRNQTIQNSNVPSIFLSEGIANTLLSASHKTIKSLEQEITQTLRPQSFNVTTNASIHIKIDQSKETAPNVIGYIKGTDSAAGCIILSAHHDHVGKNGKEIYYGAVDNASGTVAIMEIAKLLNNAIEKGIRPKRSIIIASYTGEEKGLFGSFHFAENPIFPIEKTWAVINIDMMGRVDTFYSGKRADSNYAYILVKDTLNRGLRTALFTANEKLGQLTLDTYYEQPQFMQRRLTGSDQYPFFLKGVPFIRIDCGFSKDYHKPTDTPDKINYELLSKQVKLAFLTTWNIANN